MMRDQKPILGISMGDPYGNGPEITVKALANKELYDRCCPVVIGDYCCMAYAAKVAREVSGISVDIHEIKDITEASFTPGIIDVYSLGAVKPEDLPPMDSTPKPFGVGACKIGGEAAFEYVKKVIELAMAGEIDATVTNAISKEAINMAGHHFSGHTEIYAHYTKTDKYTMMLAHHNLRVVHVSTHVSLREACDRVKKDRVLDCIRIANEGCKALGIERPKIGVAGLNRHCGKTGCSAEKKLKRSSRRSMLLWRKASISPRKSQRLRIPFFPKLWAAGMILWWSCIMIRATSP